MPSAKRYRAPRRRRRSPRPRAPQLLNPTSVAHYCRSMRALRQEAVRVILLTDQYRPFRVVTVGLGTVSSLLTHPREIYRPAIVAGADSIIVVHNHPNGDPHPSKADRVITRRLERAGQILAIPLLDHLIIAPGSFVSLRSMGLLQADVHTNHQGVRH